MQIEITQPKLKTLLSKLGTHATLTALCILQDIDPDQVLISPDKIAHMDDAYLKSTMAKFLNVKAVSEYSFEELCRIAERRTTLSFDAFAARFITAMASRLDSKK